MTKKNQPTARPLSLEPTLIRINSEDLQWVYGGADATKKGPQCTNVTKI